MTSGLLKLFRRGGDSRKSVPAAVLAGYESTGADSHARIAAFESDLGKVRKHMTGRERKTMECFMLRRIGSEYHHAGNYKKAISYELKALSLARGMGDASQEAEILSDLGTAYGLTGDLRKATNTAKKAINIFYTQGDLSHTAECAYVVGLFSNLAGRKDEAIKYASLARQLWEQLGIEEHVTGAEMLLDSIMNAR